MVERWYHLGRFANVFQAETFAAMMGAQDSIPVVADGENVIVCSDSEAIIGALTSHVMTSRLVKELKDTMNRLGLRN